MKIINTKEFVTFSKKKGKVVFIRHLELLKRYQMKSLN